MIKGKLDNNEIINQKKSHFKVAFDDVNRQLIFS